MAVVLKIFSKAPVPGAVKTRLIPALGPEGAARLQRWLTRRTVALACAAGYEQVELWCAPHSGHSFFGELARAYPVVLRDQWGMDLGERMLNALGHDPGAGAGVLVGCDCPDLDTAMLRAARQALEGDGAAVVLGPAMDGGYVLIGMHAALPELFSGMPWGTDAVLALTRRRLRALGVRALELEPVRDLDRPEDLHLLEEHPDCPPRLAPAVPSST
ncbi:MAG: TIGR04282 family arsenosugar biosynthesis glycosyltransferase [Gammaproteobacteria bacterium]|nr:TIGR04282 family arsenosugar biosynthesis glycosyltransferase [Gammaproteobacteria bacterium]